MYDFAVAQSPDMCERSLEPLASRFVDAAVDAKRYDRVALDNEFFRRDRERLPFGSELDDDVLKNRVRSGVGAAIRESVGFGPAYIRRERVQDRRYVAAAERRVQPAHDVGVV